MASRRSSPATRRSGSSRPIGGGLTHGAGQYDSVYGTIAHRLDSPRATTSSLEVEVPVNTTADVVLPADNAYAVTEGGTLLDRRRRRQDVTAADGTVTVTVGSGQLRLRGDRGQRPARARSSDSSTACRRHVDDLADAGDLTAGRRRRTSTRALGAATRRRQAALLATLGDDDADRRERSQSAPRRRSRDLRTWLATSGVDAPVRGDLDSRLGRDRGRARARP